MAQIERHAAKIDDGKIKREIFYPEQPRVRFRRNFRKQNFTGKIGYGDFSLRDLEITDG